MNRVKVVVVRHFLEQKLNNQNHLGFLIEAGRHG